MEFLKFEDVERDDSLYIGGQLLDISVLLYYQFNADQSDSLHAQEFVDNLYCNNWIYVPDEKTLECLSTFFDYRQLIGDIESFPMFISVEHDGDHAIIVCVDSKFMKSEDRLFLPKELLKEAKHLLTHSGAHIRLAVAKGLGLK